MHESTEDTCGLANRTRRSLAFELTTRPSHQQFASFPWPTLLSVLGDMIGMVFEYFRQADDIMSNRTTHWVTSGDLIIHVIVEGRPHATPLILVHGYPDNHRIWDEVAKQLSSEYLVIRYDVRGAGKSDKPKRTRDYRLPLLARDLEAVVDTIIPNRCFHLVAHDWGSIQSWESVTGVPLRAQIRSYTSISGPCLDHVGFWIRNQLASPGLEGFGKVLRQLASSWYVFLFQIPILPETIWRVGLDHYWPEYLRTQEEVANARFSKFQKADGLNGVKLYRANFLSRLLRPRVRFAACPVQIIVPTRDAFVGPQLNEYLERWTGKLKVCPIDAPHWAPLTQPKEIACAVKEFVAANP